MTETRIYVDGKYRPEPLPPTADGPFYAVAYVRRNNLPYRIVQDGLFFSSVDCQTHCDRLNAA